MGMSGWTGGGFDTPLCLNGNKLLSNCPPNLAGNSAGLTKEQKAQIEAQSNQIKEQQTNIAGQAEQIRQMKTQIEALKQIVCAINPAAGICSNKK